MASGLQPPAEAQTFAGQILTNSFVLANWYNGLQFLLNVPMALVWQSTTQGLTGTKQAITFNSTQYDTYAGHSNSTNNSRYTFQAPGVYEVYGLVTSANSSSQLNAELRYSGSALSYPSAGNTPSSSNTTSASATTYITATATGDYVELYANLSTGSQNTSVSLPMASFMLVKWIHS